MNKHSMYGVYGGFHIKKVKCDKCGREGTSPIGWLRCEHKQTPGEVWWTCPECQRKEWRKELK